MAAKLVSSEVPAITRRKLYAIFQDIADKHIAAGYNISDTLNYLRKWLEQAEMPEPKKIIVGAVLIDWMQKETAKLDKENKEADKQIASLKKTAEESKQRIRDNLTWILERFHATMPLDEAIEMFRKEHDEKMVESDPDLSRAIMEEVIATYKIKKLM